METVIKNIPLALLFAVICRSVVMGAQISDSLIVIALCGLYYLLSNLNFNKDALKVQQELKALREDLIKHQEEVREAKAFVATIKAGSALMGRK